MVKPGARRYAGPMTISAEAAGPLEAERLRALGVGEIFIPCLGSLEHALELAARVPAPVTLHVPANRLKDTDAALSALDAGGIRRVLLVSGNPGHGPVHRDLLELIECSRRRGLHVSVGAYPEDYFLRASAAHRKESARGLLEKQAAGAQRIVTQASFDAANAAAWLRLLRDRGLRLPVQLGIMPPVRPRVLARLVAHRLPGRHHGHPRLPITRADLDLLARILRSWVSRPSVFARRVADSGALGPGDGLHLFPFGGDAGALVRELRQSLAGRSR